MHVGVIRTALFNWAYARHCGGTFVFRIEDTDRTRDSEESYAGALETLRWLGLHWDEGPEAGGPHAPYRQSERLDIYAETAAQLREAGSAYPCYCTPEEVEHRNKTAGRSPGYDNFCRQLTAGQIAQFESQGRRPVLRFRMPDGATAFDDLIRGEVSFDSANVPDYVLLRADGHPLYTLTNPTDDMRMGITHVLRGEDLLSSTPRQLALYAALGVPEGEVPQFGHLPFVLGEGNTKLSKRKREASVSFYRQEGYLPEAILNYLALVGWSIGGDREDFSLDEMVEAFTLDRINRSSGRFDLAKLTDLNGRKIRALPAEDFAGRLTEFLQRDGLVSAVPSDAETATVAAAAPLVQERVATLAEASAMLRFLLVDEDSFVLDPSSAAKTVNATTAPVLISASAAMGSLSKWTADKIEAALRAALVDGLGLKPRHAFGPVRVAVTGSTISPPLFESLELLGRERTLRRLAAAAQVAQRESPED
ncbi:MAG: glutamate--tRNA ligase [Actinomycetota bacterium]|nr:glutamate--tRNA ligase [Actinomycetota bacterium]